MPMAGKRVVVTRPRAQAGTLAEKLAALGAEPILFPTIAVAPMDDDAPLAAALRRLDDYDWVVFTSANGVVVFCRELERAPTRLTGSGDTRYQRNAAPLRASAVVGTNGPDTKAEPALALAGKLPATLRLAAVGPATARALEQRGLRAAFIPDEYLAEALAAGLGEVAGRRVLLPHAELAREALAGDLRQRGATVDEIAVYRTLPAAPDPSGLAELRRGVDAITFTSASAARNFVRVQAGEPSAGEPLAAGAIIACIGPITAAAAREAGLRVDVVAAEYTLDGLVAALAEHLRHRAQPGRGPR
jgi:uroporphyrinogen-III synthase